MEGSRNPVEHPNLAWEVRKRRHCQRFPRRVIIVNYLNLQVVFFLDKQQRQNRHVTLYISWTSPEILPTLPEDQLAAMVVYRQ